MTAPLLKLGDTATWRTYPNAKAGPLYSGPVRAIVPAGKSLRAFALAHLEDASWIASPSIGRVLDSRPAWDRYLVRCEEGGRVVWRAPAVGLVDRQQQKGTGA